MRRPLWLPRRYPIIDWAALIGPPPCRAKDFWPRIFGQGFLAKGFGQGFGQERARARLGDGPMMIQRGMGCPLPVSSGAAWRPGGGIPPATGALRVPRGQPHANQRALKLLRGSVAPGAGGDRLHRRAPRLIHSTGRERGFK